MNEMNSKWTPAIIKFLIEEMNPLRRLANASTKFNINFNYDGNQFTHSFNVEVAEQEHVASQQVQQIKAGKIEFKR